MDIGGLSGILSDDFMPRLSPPKLSLIIPCKGHAAELRFCLEGIQQMTIAVPFDTTVVDSDSDPLVLSVVGSFPDVRLVRSERNLNAGSARNLGAEHARGELLAFLDADCIPSREWLNAAYEALADGAQMVGGPVLDALPDNPIPVADNFLQFTEFSPGRPEGRVDLLPGCNLALRREAFEAVGGFRNMAQLEDVLLTSSIAERWPQQCYFIPKMQIEHWGRTTLGGLWNHHKQFGYVRGFHGFRIKRSQQKLGRRWIAIPFVILKRFRFMFDRAYVWKRHVTCRKAILLPLLFFGQLGWAIGFRRGCRDALWLGD
jgi:cellulose synthase/poly-beta-1,6-N-acetylglucosamine synthase-like glycosyltransferase